MIMDFDEQHVKHSRPKLVELYGVLMSLWGGKSGITMPQVFFENGARKEIKKGKKSFSAPCPSAEWDLQQEKMNATNVLWEPFRARIAGMFAES